MGKDEDLIKLLGDKDTFAMDLADYQRDYHQLLQKRGIPVEIYSWVDQPITETSITNCLKYFYGNAPIALLTYFYEADQLKIWFFSTEGMQFKSKVDISEGAFRQLGKELNAGLEISKYEHARKAFKRGIGLEVDPDPGSGENLEDIIKQLSRLLFPEGLGACLSQQEIEHVIIIPALNMQQIPFSMLTPFNDHTLFIDKWSYSIAASIYDIAGLILRKQTEQSQATSYTVDEKDLFVGNPKFNAAGKWVLPPLPGAEEEVNAIARFLSLPKEQLLIGAEAALPAIKKKSKEAGLLYFATHGVADPDDPLDGSGLFFTPSENDPHGFWSARAIQEDDFSAALVVLSACQTGLGQSQDAGIIGLSRAFHLAGAENIIMSLWSVDDLATSSLMQLFLKKIQKPHRFFPSGPLRLAMLEYRALHPQARPLFWAAFSTFGIPY